MENENKKNPFTSSVEKTPQIRTLQRDLDRARGAKPTDEQIQESFPLPKKIISPIPPFQGSDQTGEGEKPIFKPEQNKPKAAEKPAVDVTPVPEQNPFIKGDFFPSGNLAPKETPKKPAFEMSPIQTYSDDVANVVKSGNTSMIEIAVAEQKSREEKEKTEAKEKTETQKSVFMVIGSIVFIAISLGIFYYFIFIKKTDVPVVVEEKNDILKAEAKEKILFSTNREKLVRELGEAMEKTLPSSSVRIVEIEDETTAKPPSAEEFLSVIGESIPQFLARSFQGEFLTGAYSNQKNHPFIILKIDSFENVFSGMLKWEENMKKDLGELFISNEDRGILTGAGSGAPSSVFEDVVIKNQDVRMMKNKTGESILLYAFANKDILIITTDPATLLELEDRLKKSQILR